MNLRDLHYLTTIAETLHFGRAAAACHVSQPTLSMQLKKLEETLGVALFERSNKRVMLTPAGHEIASKAREILQDVAQMKALAQSRRDPLAGRVTLGLFPTLAPYVLPHVMPALTRHFPSIEWRLIEEKTPVLEAQLQSGALDVALLAAPVALAGTTQHFLFHEPFLLALGTSHPLARQKRIRRERMASTNLLLLEEGHCLRDQSLSYCERLGMGESQPVVQCSQRNRPELIACLAPNRRVDVEVSGVQQ